MPRRKPTPVRPDESARGGREQPDDVHSAAPDKGSQNQTGRPQGAGRMSLFLWGIPLLLFIVVAVAKSQCGG